MQPLSLWFGHGDDDPHGIELNDAAGAARARVTNAIVRRRGTPARLSTERAFLVARERLAN